MVLTIQAAVLEVFARESGKKPLALTQTLLSAKTAKARQAVENALASDQTEFVLHIYFQMQHAQVACDAPTARSLTRLLHRLRLQNPEGVLGASLVVSVHGAPLPEPPRPENLREMVYQHAPNTGIPTVALRVRKAHISTEQANWLAYRLEQASAGSETSDTP